MFGMNQRTLSLFQGLLAILLGYMDQVHSGKSKGTIIKKEYCVAPGDVILKSLKFTEVESRTECAMITENQQKIAFVLMANTTSSILCAPVTRMEDLPCDLDIQCDKSLLTAVVYKAAGAASPAPSSHLQVCCACYFWLK